MRLLIVLLSSGFYVGYIPFASGTFGTALAALILWPVARFNALPSEGGSPWVYLLIFLLITAVGIWTAGEAEKIHDKRDSGKIIIDEIAGFFVAMFLLPFEWVWVGAAFFVFRFFDVLKPWPVRWLERLPGGFGVVCDDLAAGVYSCVLLHAARLILDRL